MEIHSTCIAPILFDRVARLETVLERLVGAGIRGKILEELVVLPSDNHVYQAYFVS